jgi:hypothetical protein
MIAAALIASGCSSASSEGDASNGAAPAVGQTMQLTRHQVEAAHLEQLNAWIAEQDRVKPPAPSVGKPTGFSEGRCIAVEGETLKCSYSYFDGGRKQDVTANFFRDSNGVWRIR